jgi:hypothetical protein
VGCALSIHRLEGSRWPLRRTGSYRFPPQVLPDPWCALNFSSPSWIASLSWSFCPLHGICEYTRVRDLLGKLDRDVKLRGLGKRRARDRGFWVMAGGTCCRFISQLTKRQTSKKSVSLSVPLKAAIWRRDGQLAPQFAAQTSP